MQHANMSASTQSASAQVRTGRIQVEVREIPVVNPQVILSRHDVDGDGGDIRNE
jgi:hypothetical protein